MKYRDLVREMESNGWFLVRQRGSHRIYQHLLKGNNVIIAGHTRNEDVPIGILKAVRKQLGEDQ